MLRMASDRHDEWDLSTDRANAARRILVDNGVLDEQISKISGFADTVPDGRLFTD